MNIYSDRAFLPEGVPHAPLLYPFWGFRSPYGEGALGRRAHEHYIEHGSELFNLTGLREAALAVLPFHWEQVVDYDIYHSAKRAGDDARGPARLVCRAEEFVASAAREGRRSAVFFSHDQTDAVPLDNAVVFRTSMLASARRPNEHAMPFWMPDEVEALFGGELPLREKAGRPSVGFCGHNPLKLDARAKLGHKLSAVPGASRVARRLGVNLAGDHPFRARAEALASVSRSRDVEANFILRDAWFNGAFVGGRVDLQLMDESRRAFTENMFGSDYVLCTRGGGNYSIRFYETLSSGRIPVFVDTDCVLPFEEWIDWRRYCVWVEGREVSRVAERIAEFHEGLSPAEFKDRQRACRRLWEEWLSPYGFFKNMRRYFD
jgi:hypothetical protein